MNVWSTWMLLEGPGVALRAGGFEGRRERAEAERPPPDPPPESSRTRHLAGVRSDRGPDP